MKRCPICSREYDNSMMFCLDDGAELLYGPAAADEPATAILSEPPASAGGQFASESATRHQIHTTERTAVLPGGAESEPRQSWNGTSEKQSFSTNRTAKPLLILAAAAVLLIGGYFGYRYFAVEKVKHIESIAVMPFTNDSGNAENEFLSDGMTETLISSLTQLPNLSVKARSSVFRYKGKETDIRTIGKDLNVQAILTGRVMQRGDLLTVSLELVDVATENAVWSQQYNRKQSDLVTLQSEIARDVSGKLKSKLSGPEAAKLQKAYTTDPDAYQQYLKGKFYWNNRTSESLKKALEFYQGAIEKDPNYALAYSGLAETYVLFSSYGVAPADDSMPQAKAAATKALEIDEQLAEAHTALGFYLEHYEWDREGAQKEFRRAIELNPNYATAHHWYSSCFSNVKQFDKSIAELRLAEELDPLSRIIGTNLGDAFTDSRKFDEGIAQYKRVLVRDPNFGYAHRALGRAYGLKGMYAEAISESERAVELGNAATGHLGFWLARAGRRADALKMLEKLKRDSALETIQDFDFALIYLGLGQKEEALNYLEKHMAARAETASLYASGPELDELRSEPRFKAMLKKMNLPE